MSPSFASQEAPPQAVTKNWQEAIGTGMTRSAAVRNRPEAAADSRGFLISHFINRVIISPRNQVGRKLTTECESFQGTSADECLLAAWFMPSDPQVRDSQNEVGCQGIFRPHSPSGLLNSGFVPLLGAPLPWFSFPGLFKSYYPFKWSSGTHSVAPTSFYTDLPSILKTAYLSLCPWLNTISRQKLAHTLIKTPRSTLPMLVS